MTLRRRRKDEMVYIRVDKRTKAELARAALALQTTVSAMLLSCWRSVTGRSTQL